jgi:hypothetical protein
MALESTGQRQRSVDIYKKLGRTGTEEVRRAARRLNYGVEAMAKLKFTDEKVPDEMNKVRNLHLLILVICTSEYCRV